MICELCGEHVATHEMKGFCYVVSICGDCLKEDGVAS